MEAADQNGVCGVCAHPLALAPWGTPHSHLLRVALGVLALGWGKLLTQSVTEISGDPTRGKPGVLLEP